MWGHMPQNSYPKKVGSKVDIKCDLFLLKTVEIKGWHNLWCWYMSVSSSLKYSVYPWHPWLWGKNPAGGEKKNKKQSWDSGDLASSHKLWLHKIYFFKKKLNSNWWNEPGRQKKDRTYGHIAKSQTFSSPEGLKCLHQVKMK